MKTFYTGLVVAAFAGAALSACGPRQVDVRTAPSTASATSVQVNNTLNQGVNVYVSQNGTDTFLRQVAANSSVTIPVQGYGAGTTVTLRAVTVDGVHTYTRNNVTLSGTVVFPLCRAVAGPLAAGLRWLPQLCDGATFTLPGALRLSEADHRVPRPLGAA